VHDPLGDSVLGLVGCAVRLEGVLLLLKACDVLELVSFFFEEFVNLLLILYYPLSNNLPMLNDR